jgi:hypothetical protein
MLTRFTSLDMLALNRNHSDSSVVCYPGLLGEMLRQLACCGCCSLQLLEAVAASVEAAC